MLDTPYFIAERGFQIEDLFREDDKFVTVDLPETIDDGLEIYIVDNCIVRAIIDKYPDSADGFREVMFDDTEEFSWETPMFGSDLYRHIHDKIGTIDVIFRRYELLSENVRRQINQLVRVGCVCAEHKLLFHVLSKHTYYELYEKGFEFPTQCDYEKILMNHEVQQFGPARAKYFIERKNMGVDGSSV